MGGDTLTSHRAPEPHRRRPGRLRRRALLLGQARGWAADRGIDLTLDVVDDHRGTAIALYQRTGWTFTGTSIAAWTGPAGEPVRVRHYALP